MQIEIKRWGNSAGLPLSKPLLAQLSVEQGDSVEVLVQDGGIFLKPVVKQNYTLEGLLSSCTPEAMQLNEEDREWLQDSPVGGELE